MSERGGGAAAGASKRVSLADVSVPRLFFALLHQRFTGTLVLDQPAPHAGPRQVWLRGGMPVHTNWVAPAEVLGQVLLARQVIDEGQLLRALEAMAAQGGLLGSHLLAQGVVDRPQLLDGLRTQCASKLKQAFALRDGEALVTVGDASDLDADLLPLNVLSLVLAGVGASYDEARVVAEMGPAFGAPLRATGALARYRSHFRFRPGDEAVLEGLEQGAEIGTLAALPGVGPQRAAQLVYTLWACQMLKTGVAADAGVVAAAVAPAAGRAVAPQPTPARARATPPPIAARPPTPTPAPRPPTPTPSPQPPAAMRPRQSTSVDADAPASEEHEFVAELEALEAKLEARAHAFELFGLSLSATKRDVRAAWAELSRKFHPDALQAQGRGHLRERVNDVFAALSEAQQLIGDAEQRDKLRAAIEKGEHEPAGANDATARAHAAFQSELLAKEGDKLLRANRFDRALERYREAAKHNDEEPDLKAAIAWCTYQLSAKGTTDAALLQVALAAALEEAPRLARAHYFLGFVLSDQGRTTAAVEAFRTAAKLDPRLIDAERQARALKLRTAAAEAPPSRLGGLKGFFGGGKK